LVLVDGDLNVLDPLGFGLLLLLFDLVAFGVGLLLLGRRRCCLYELLLCLLLLNAERSLFFLLDEV